MSEKSENFAMFWRGFKSAAPLWFAGVPFALAYIIVAREANLTGFQTQMMSLTVYNAATQIIVSQFLVEQVPILTIIITVLAMNIHHLLYGLALRQRFKLNPVKRAMVAFPLTDFAYGITITQAQDVGILFLVGIEVSVFLSWNFYTGLAILFSPLLVNLSVLRLDFIIPLTFLLLLVSLIKTRIEIMVALFSIVMAGICFVLGYSNLAVPIVSIIAPIFGIGLMKLRGQEVA